MKRIRLSLGFSLVEALVGIAMASMIVVVIGSALSSVYKIYTASTMKQEALAYAQEPLDLITAYGNSTHMFGCKVTDPCAATCNTILPGYQSCWMQYPSGLSSNSPLHLENTSGFWQFQSGSETVPSNASFTRSISIVHLCRDAQGALVTCGTEDYNSKKITVTVSWKERNQDKSLAITKILNGWKNVP